MFFFSVKPHGTIFHAGPQMSETIHLPAYNSYLTMVSLTALRTQNVELYRSIIEDVLELANQGIIGAHISATFDLPAINDAIKYIEDKKCTGKVLIEMD